MAKELYFLVGENSEVGDKFRIQWNEVCRSCRYNKICFNEKKIGHYYKIVEIRKPKSQIYCKLIEAPAMLAVVEETAIQISMGSSSAVEGVSVLYSPITCSERQCPYIKYCVDNGQALTGRVRIEKVIERLDCPIGLDLTLVEVRPEPPEHSPP